jgi:hypothetical protein
LSWVEIAVVFFVCHEVGDYLLQTEWQAIHKPRGLGRDRTARRALLSHVAGYTAAFIPAFIWLWGKLGAWTVVIAVLIAVPHLIQDDRRLLYAYIRSIKHTEPDKDVAITRLVDQGFHFVALFLTALLAHALS